MPAARGGCAQPWPAGPRPGTSLPAREEALLRDQAAAGEPLFDIAGAFAALAPLHGTGLSGALDSAVWRAAAEVRQLLAGDRPRAMVRSAGRELWAAGTLGARPTGRPSWPG